MGAREGNLLLLARVVAGDIAICRGINQDVAREIYRGGLVHRHFPHPLTCGTVEHLKAVPLRHLRNALNFLLELLKL